MCVYVNVALALLVTFVSEAATADEVVQKDCQLKQYASVDFVPTSADTLIIPVTINDRPASMILNTALGLSVVGDGASNVLGLQTKDWPSGLIPISIGSTKVDKIATADSVSIGALSFGKAEFLVDKERKVNVDGPSPVVVGMIGLNFFSNVDFELDFAKRKMNLFSQDHCPGAVVYWADRFSSVPMRNGSLGDMYFLMELEGKKIQTVLSTVGSTTILFTDASKKLFGFDDKSQGVATETDTFGNTTSYYQAMALTTDGLTVMNAKIKLSGAKTKDCRINKKIDKDAAAGYDGCYGVYPLRLGMNVLQKMHIYFATKERVMYFTGIDAKRSEPTENK